MNYPMGGSYGQNRQRRPQYPTRQTQPSYQYPQVPIGPNSAPPAPDNIYPGGDLGEGKDYDLRNQSAQDEMNAYLQGQLGGQSSYDSAFYGSQMAGYNEQLQAELANQGSYNNAFYGNQMANNQAGNTAQLDRYNSQLSGNNNIRVLAAGLATRGQISSAQGALRPSMDYYGDLMNGGARYQQALASESEGVNNQAKTLGQNANSQLSARGLGGNAFGAAALQMGGQFAAGGARGQLGTQLHNQGAAGYGDLSKTWADYAARPTQEGALSQLQQVQDPTFNGQINQSDYHGTTPQFNLQQSNYKTDLSGLQSIYDRYNKPVPWIQGQQNQSRYPMGGLLGGQNQNPYAPQKPYWTQ